MAIQIAGGTIVNFTWTSNGTRSDMQSNIVTQLTNAGWSVVSGGGTSDTLMQSATTPQGLRCQIRCYDPGSGNCAQFTMRDVGGLSISAIAYMLPTNGKQFRIIANKYQFFVFSTGGANNNVAREIMMGGTPYIPSNIVSIVSSPDWYWFLFTGDTDITTTARNFQFRSLLWSNSAADFGGWSVLYNGTAFSGLVASNSNTPPCLALSGGGHTSAGSTLAGATFADGSTYSVKDAEIGWGNGARTAVWNIFGQLWDAALVTVNMNGEQLELIPPDSTAKYMSITHQGGQAPVGTLLVRVTA